MPDWGVWTLKIVLVLVALLAIVACALVAAEQLWQKPGNYLGTRESHWEPKQKQATAGFGINPARAFELAMPFLTESLRQRDRMRGREPAAATPTAPGDDHLTLDGEWYVITRDRYPYIYRSGVTYLQHGVRVHTQTGEVRRSE